MISINRLLALGMVLAVPTMLQAQHFDFNLDEGISVEESYLQESVELMIIREQSRAESREMKLSALSNIKAAIEKGSKNREVLNSLEYMSLEGILNKTVHKGTDYPDIRAKSAACLGELGSPEASEVLIRLLTIEHEVTVLTEAVKSLTKIGINEKGKTVHTITKMLTRSDMFYPDNLLTLACLDAYEQFADQNGGRLAPDTVLFISHISEGPYHGSVRQRAKQLLAKLRTYRRN
jgi:hypothetical protein